MSLKRAVSISLGSLSGRVGSRLSNEESSKDRLFIFAILCNVDYCTAQKENFKVPTFAKASKSKDNRNYTKGKLQLYYQCVNSVLPWSSAETCQTKQWGLFSSNMLAEASDRALPLCCDWQAHHPMSGVQLGSKVLERQSYFYYLARGEWSRREF